MSQPPSQSLPPTDSVPRTPRPQLKGLSGIDQDAEAGALSVRLGRREREVLTVLWEQGSASVQQVAEKLSTALAYTTVMTTLDRLFKKGLVHREKKDRAFVYSSALSAQEVEEQRATDLIRRFFSDSEQQEKVLLSCLIDAVQQYDTRLLDQLESEIRSARARNLSEGRSHHGGK